jgi:putative ABC transport system permease protein
VTLAGLVVRNLRRNKRRSLLTVFSLAFSFLLLTLMITVWRSFFIDPWTAKGALRLVCRNRISLFVPMPSYYREKIQAVPHVANVAPLNRFDGMFKDQISFIQMGTDPNTFLDVYAEYEIPSEQVAAWQQDAAGAIADSKLAEQMKWKIGDHIIIQGVKFPLDLELTIRGIFHSPMQIPVVYFNWKYAETKIHRGKDEVFLVSADSIDHVGQIAKDVDAIFRNSPTQTRTEAEQAFDMDAVAMFGNVKAFLLSISLAVLFATLLVSATTVAMSIRERTREVAVLRAMGFLPKMIIILFVAEAVVLCLVGWFLASAGTYSLFKLLVPENAPMAIFIKIKALTLLASLPLAGAIGVLSAVVPSYRVSRMNIVQGLRHIG